MTHAKQNTGNDEWMTPVEYIELARKTMGSIDTDPATNPLANTVIGANEAYIKADNGLRFEWTGNVFLNPPYSRNLIGQFANKLVDEQTWDQAILLVNAQTSAKWFHKVANEAASVCFLGERIKFMQEVDGQLVQSKGSPGIGQAVFYFGRNRGRFVRLWKPVGLVTNFL